MSNYAIAFDVVISEMFEENAYLVYLDDRTDCIVVDPGLDPDQICTKITQIQRTPVAIFNTHGHADHIAGNATIKAEWPDIPLIIGAGDSPKLGDPALNLSGKYGFGLVSPPADRTVADGEVLDFAGIRWTVRETPGHSEGHVVFIAMESIPMIVLGGDVLFSGSVGRTDLLDGDQEALAHSIRTKLYCLPDDAVVLPGHGPATTVGHEKRTNPFVRA